MADIKITDLAAYSDPTSTDVLPIVDVGSDITKKVTIADLLENAGAGTAAAPSFSFDGDNDTGIYKPAANQVGITAGGTQALLIESTGVTVPGNLTVQGTTTTIDTTTLVVEDKNVELGSVTTPTDTTANGGGITLKGASDKTINWVQSTGCWTFNQPTNFNDHVRIDSSGNVGIGTSSAGARLHVEEASPTDGILLKLNNNVNSSGSQAGLRIRHNDTDQLECNLLTERTGLNAGLDFKIELSNSSGTVTERLRVDEDGNVGIGTSSPDSLVHLRAASGNAVIRLENSNTSVASAESLGSIEWESNDASTGGTGVAAKLNVVDDNGFGTAYGMTFSTGLVSGGSMTLSERLRIDSSGRLLVGNTSEIQSGSQLEITGTNAGAVLTLGRNDSSISAGNGMGAIDFYGNAGGTYQHLGRILSVAEETHALNSKKTGLAFHTNNGSASASERARIDGLGRLLVGTTSNVGSTAADAYYAKLQVVGRADGGTNDGRIAIVRNENSASITDQERIGRIVFADQQEGTYALIDCRADGNAGSSDYPGNLIFSTTADGASSATERLRITSSGEIRVPAGIGNQLRFENQHSSTADAAISTFDDGVGTLLCLGSNFFFNAAGAETRYNTGEESAAVVVNRTGNISFLTNGTSATATERMRINSSGRVGIGTSSPLSGANLTVAGAALAVTGQNTAHSANSIRIGEEGSGAAQIRCYGPDTSTNGSLTFRTSRSDGSNSKEVIIDSSGRLLVGASSVANAGIGQRLYVAQTGGESIANIRYGNNSNPSYFYLGKSRSTSVNNYAVLQNGDEIGRIVWAGADGTDLANFAASISCFVDGTPGTDDMPGRLVFKTRGDGANSETERLRIDSSGRLLVGTTSSQAHASANLVEIGNYTLTNAGITINSPTDGAGLINFGDSSSSNRRGRIEYTHVADAFRLYTADSERMRINSSGNVGIGTSSPGARLEVVGSDDANNLVVSSGNTDFAVYNDDTIGEVRLVAEDGSTNNNSKFLTLYTQASGTSSSTERMRITSGGFVNIGNGGTDIIWNQTSTTGVGLGTVGVIQAARDGDQLMLLNRLTNDGTLVSFAQNGTLEGVITVSGGTVSYNGGHLARWSQLAGGAERTEILRGSVLSNLDEMCEWGEEDNEQLNRMKVSDAEGDVNVSGVFQAWDDDDDTYTNDFYCAMTGDFVIRIAQGTTVARGDLLMSAGDGTAKPQDDDIVRSKTIAKVTSTTVSTTYADGSYCVPCVLMAC